MQETGIIKYNCNWIKAEAIDYPIISELNAWRNALFNLQYIGAYDSGIGYGNISCRLQNNTFLISGSATGHLTQLTNQHYTTVIDVDIEKNTLTCKGPIQASSESLTHAAIYMCNPDIQAVIHIHSKKLWMQLLNKVPTSLASVAYGTPAMANEIVRLFRETDVNNQKIIAMTGHTDGVITFGQSLDEAARIILNV